MATRDEGRLPVFKQKQPHRRAHNVRKGECQIDELVNQKVAVGDRLRLCLRALGIARPDEVPEVLEGLQDLPGFVPLEVLLAVLDVAHHIDVRQKPLDHLGVQHFAPSQQRFARRAFIAAAVSRGNGLRGAAKKLLASSIDDAERSP